MDQRRWTTDTECQGTYGLFRVELSHLLTAVIEVNNARFAQRDVAFTDAIQCLTTQLSCFELQLFMVTEMI